MNTIRLKREQALKSLILRLERKHDSLLLQSRRLSSLRMIVFLVSLSFIWLMKSSSSPLLQYLIPGAGFTCFGLMVILHYRILAKIRYYRAWLKIKKAQYAQMRLDWTGLLHKDPAYAFVSDPINVDLNLTGPKSLHHLINFAVSEEGGNRLEEWLRIAEPDFDTVERRQSVVRELLGAQRFRERFLLAYFQSQDQRLEDRKLLTWLEQDIFTVELKGYLAISMCLCIMGWSMLVLFLLEMMPPLWILCLIIYVGFYQLKSPHIRRVMEEVQELDDELNKLKPVLNFLESYPYKNLPLTQKICRPFTNSVNPPSKLLKMIKFYTTAIGLRMNPLMALLLNLVVPWDLLFAHLIERQKVVLKELLPLWMDIFNELEALISLANFAYINPHYTFPQLYFHKESNKCFRAVDIGHPLISQDKKVRNDFIFTKLGEVVLLTGSNMTGKSTFLKILGINLKLAFAGGPVDARHMVTDLFRVMTSIRIQDSLAEEVSYFYAEVKRLKHILNALEEKTSLPVFFLIDEILKGTNNHERYLGSKPYIKAVSGKHGVGLITTHDVTLCGLEKENQLISNYHFGDTVSGGRFAFDHKMLPGPSTSTNALKILKSEGLPLEEYEGQDIFNGKR